ncbi:MAG TPA: porin, partial [Armatimonadota bacterium]|nr:porin [Armatimonadota bacterium]
AQRAAAPPAAPARPGAPATGGAASGTAAAPPRAQVFGYVQSQFEDTSPGDASRFFMRRVRLGVRGQLEKSFAYEVQADLSSSTGILRNAWIDYTGWQPAVFRFGQFKLPYSLEAIESSTTLPFIERSLAVDQIAFTHERDTGLAFLSRNDPEKWYGYALSLTNGAGRNQFVATENKLFAGRVQVNTPRSRPVLGGMLAAGFSTRQGHTMNLNQPAALRNEDERYGADLDFLARRLHLRAEYLWGRNDDRNPHGYYGLAAYRLSEPWEIAARYEGFTPDDESGSTAHRTTFGVNYYFSRTTKAMLNYELLSGRAPGDMRSGIRLRLQTLFP